MNNIEQVKTAFQNLSDINRLKIILFIGNESKTVNEIVSSMGISQPLVSHHLKKLKECNILSTSRKGPFINYFLTNKNLLKNIDDFSETLI